MSKDNKTIYTLKEYNCGYCKYIFRQYIRKTGGGEDSTGRIMDSTSSQVVCPKCKNFLKSWDEGIKVQEVTSDKRVSNRYEGVKQ